MLKKILFLCLFTYLSALEATVPHKVLICGVCRNIESTIPYTIKNAEALGERFEDYKIIIYENNSTDRTANLLTEWALRNQKVLFFSENVPSDLLPPSRTERIARARNIVLDVVKRNNYQDYPYLIMVDLDFPSDWPISEIVETILSPREWDCVSANGITKEGAYWDLFAYRSQEYPFGPELFGDVWWDRLVWFSLNEQDWIPVYSAFGGLTIYKTATLIHFSYSGLVTSDLANYYKQILPSLSPENAQRNHYLKLMGAPDADETMIGNIPILFQYYVVGCAGDLPIPPHVACCEHVPLHASMAMHGFNKMYINPNMRMKYFAAE